jgi:hypothetical protein
MKHLIIMLVAAAALLTGTIATAQASPGSRSNAVRVAKDYLQSQGFSYKGLVSQLKYEGFSAGDASYGASHSGANWTKEAVVVARDYLDSQGFSRRGLIEQLEYEGFTPAQALYGARAAGL